MHKIMKYIQTGELLGDEKHAHKVWVQAARFTLINDSLSRRSFGGSYLKCLGNLETQYILVELHEGVYSNHAGGRTLAHRAHTQEYYWPIIRQDAENYVKKCDWC